MCVCVCVCAVIQVIILEDDMDLADDFFEYFQALSVLLDSDPTLLAISSWNDNGKHAHVYSETQLYRQVSDL